MVTKTCQRLLVMSEVRSTTDVNLYPYGDKELWYAQGEDWALPLFVTFHEDKANERHWAFLEPVFSLYTSQLLTLTKLFEAHDIFGTNKTWLILKQTCEAILHKAPGVTAERYYKWPDCKARPMPPLRSLSYTPEKPVGPTEIPQDQRAFVNYVSETSSLPTSVVRIVLEAVAEAAPSWMLEKHKAVDLGFCRIITAPFRANWKEIVTFKLGGRNLLKTFSTHRNGELIEELKKAGLPEVMASPHNIGLRDRRIDYVLEVTPAGKFERFAKELSDRIATRGSTSHVQHYEESVESLYVELVETLRYYIKKVSAPFARVSYRVGASVLGLLPAKRQAFKSVRLPLADLPQRIIPTASNFSVFAEQDRLDLVQKKVASLPEVSGVLPQEDDVWRRNIAANVECLPVEPGAAGLSLYNVGKELTAGQPVLPGPEVGTGNTSGLDG